MYQCRLQGKQKAVFVFESKHVFILYRQGWQWMIKEAATREEHGPFPSRESAIRRMEKINEEMGHG